MKTVLVIEDDRDVRENTTEVLHLAGYRPLRAENGKVGIELARQHLPDIILCDIMMPVVDGYSVLHMLGREQSTAEIPFIFVSAKAERWDIRQGMEMGADDYITKPFKESELLNAIASRLKRKEVFSRNFANSADGFHAFLNEASGLAPLKELRQDRRVRSVPAKDVLYREGDRMNEVFLIDKGRVRTYRTTDDGKELSTGLYSEGDFIGYMNALQGGVAQETAETLSKADLVWIPVNDLVALLYKDRDVSMRFIKMLSKDVKQKEDQLVSIAYGSVRQRLAQALLRMREAHRVSDEEPEIHVRREDLASMIGTATESVVRSLGDMREEGLVEFKGRGILISDAKAMERLATL